MTESPFQSAKSANDILEAAAVYQMAMRDYERIQGSGNVNEGQRKERMVKAMDELIAAAQITLLNPNHGQVVAHTMAQVTGSVSAKHTEEHTNTLGKVITKTWTWPPAYLAD